MIIRDSEARAFIESALPDFTAPELACPCCNALVIDTELMLRLQLIRTDIDMPIIITSGHRCAKHNKTVGGAKSSAHLEFAVDVSTPNSEYRDLIVRRAGLLGIPRIGIAKTFTHLDMITSRPFPRMWVYQ